jgi:ubiquitin-small subunit ribosomal protein S27Ae
MADKKKEPSMKKSAYYKVSGDKVDRTKKPCPKCGPGVFLGEHSNRVACGKCGYTEFKKK